MAYTYIWGRPTETSEMNLMLTYISWFTAIRKKCSVSELRSVSRDFPRANLGPIFGPYFSPIEIEIPNL